jgi:hypothetical protein
MRVALLAALAALAGCSDPAGAPDALPPAPCVVGDPEAEPEVQLIYRTAGGVAAPLLDGGTLDIQTPPQGGKVVFVGMRVRNVVVCQAFLQAALRDTCTPRVFGIESRPIAWRLAADGFAEPAQPEQISDYANVPVCPNATLAHDIDGHPAWVEVRLYERSGRVTERIVQVVPTCEADLDPALCRCECDSDYVAGRECPSDPDGGVIECPPAE